jgi:hypothetical protein
MRAEWNKFCSIEQNSMDEFQHANIQISYFFSSRLESGFTIWKIYNSPNKLQYSVQYERN